MKLKIYNVIIFFILIFFVGCSDSEPKNPIIAGTELITNFAYDGTNDYFTYHLPDDVKSAALWVYQGTSAPAFDDNEITDPDGIKAGAYPIPTNAMLTTSLMTVTAGKLTAVPWTPSGVSWCFVLGFDENYHLVASSPLCGVSSW